MRTVDELTELFRRRGRKVTPQRRSVFAVLARADHHPTAEAVYAEVSAEMPTISLRTVYQTLNDLADMGELVSLDLGTGATRFDPNLEPHHHLVCDGCGRVTDLHAEALPVTPAASRLHGFEVTTTEIVLRGRCAACRHAAPGSTAPSSPPTHQPTGGATAHG